LYDELLKKGLLENSELYPALVETPIDTIISKIPQALRHDTTKLLEGLVLQLKDNKVVINNRSVSFDMFIKTITDYILKASPSKSQAELIRTIFKKPLDQEIKPKWKTFEDILNGP